MDYNDNHTWKLVDHSHFPDNFNFAINENELWSLQEFDFESQEQYSIKIRGTDSYGLYCQKEFLIFINDTLDTPFINISNTKIYSN